MSHHPPRGGRSRRGTRRHRHLGTGATNQTATAGVTARPVPSRPTVRLTRCAIGETFQVGEVAR